MFIDTNLPACKQGTKCASAEKLDHSYVSSQMRTTIGFGINKDEYVEKPAAVVESDVVMHVQAFSSQLSGSFADAAGVSAMINLTFEPIDCNDDGECMIRFKASQIPSQGASTEPIEVIWSDNEVTYFVQRLEPGAESEWRFLTEPPDSTSGGENAILTMRQGGKTIAATTTPVPEGKVE